uniref:Uncharacterized protein MANES_11G028900 n=1 Tax=Rhizophora mucronata TaxID=61149 RepID=A0A2P2P578_RHIMU
MIVRRMEQKELSA